MKMNSENKKTVEKYMVGFNEGDHPKILSCLTEDVIWEMPGTYRHVGKVEFDKEIENEAFEGRPSITLFRMTEQDNVVIAEGAVKCKMKDGPVVDMVFCDVFEMEDAKIKKLISYIMQR